MSFQSDPLRAIPRPGFVIYISTIVWSSDFRGALIDHSFLPRLTSSLVSGDEQISGPCQILHAHSIILKTVDLIQTTLQLKGRLKSKGY